MNGASVMWGRRTHYCGAREIMSTSDKVRLQLVRQCAWKDAKGRTGVELVNNRTRVTDMTEDLGAGMGVPGCRYYA